MTTERPYHLSFASAALAILMLAALGTATLWDMLDGPNSPREEAVAKTPAVALSKQALRDLPGDARYYLANRYALKEAFIDLDARIKRRLLGREWTREVNIGEDGFLFLRNKRAVGQAQGQFRASEQVVEAWATHFARLKQAMAAKGAPFAFIIGPNKHSIYPDQLPRWLASSDQTGALTEAVLGSADQSGGFAAPDLTAHLRNVRAGAPLLYHRTDTHWTEFGAAQAIRHALGPLGFDLPQPEVVQHPEGRGGDLSRLTGWRPESDATAPFIERSASVACLANGQPFDLHTADPLPVKQFACRNDQAPYGDVVVFMDSFGVSAAPAIANGFRNSRFFWTDSVDLRVVESLSPDLVIQILVERKLPDLAPASLLRGGAG